MIGSLSFSSSLCADGLTSIAYLATQTSTPDWVGFDGFKRNTFLFAPLLRNQAVVKILPQCPVLTEIDLNGDLPAFLIGQKLNTGHSVLLTLTTLAPQRPPRHRFKRKKSLVVRYDGRIVRNFTRS